MSLSFEQSTADPCVYVKRASSGIVVIAVNVDDLIVAVNTMEEMKNIKECLIAARPTGSSTSQGLILRICSLLPVRSIITL